MLVYVEAKSTHCKMDAITYKNSQLAYLVIILSITNNEIGDYTTTTKIEEQIMKT